MKKLLTVLPIAAVLCVWGAGCAADDSASESPVRLDTVQLSNLAVSGTVDNAEQADLYARLNAPKKYKNELVSKKGWLRIHADAEVLLPDGGLPMAYTEAQSLTAEDIRRYADVLQDPKARLIDIE